MLKFVYPYCSMIDGHLHIWMVQSQNPPIAIEHPIVVHTMMNIHNHHC